MSDSKYVVTVNGEITYGPTDHADATKYAEFYGGVVRYTWEGV